MAFHEKHQYFYEKYLRNEMPEKERHDFEEKLSSDESFRHSFHHYKHHRKEYLTELLDEDSKEAKKRWSLNSWLYLLISTTGIALAINYYFFMGKEPITSNNQGSKSWNIINRIPFLATKNEPLKNQHIIKHEGSTFTENKTDSMEVSKSIANGNQYDSGDENSDFVNDVMDLDSFVQTFDKTSFELRFKSIKSETDSIIVDSALEALAAKSVSRNLQQSKQIMIYVEFWRSPINFKGYKFNGKKLVVYGILFPYEIYLLREGDEFILRTPHNETILTRDNNFHKF